MSSREPGSLSPERLQRSQQKILEQHEHLDALQLDLRVALDAGDVAAAERTLGSFSGAVEAHFELEESAYFPEQSALPDDAAARFDGLMGDHETLRQRLAGLRERLAKEGVDALRASFDSFVSDLEDHEAREEKAMELITRQG